MAGVWITSSRGGLGAGVSEGVRGAPRDQHEPLAPDGELLALDDDRDQRAGGRQPPGGCVRSISDRSPPSSSAVALKNISLPRAE